ncbi:MAG: hypothetical protein NT069_21350, partial [Planctomycetota bacterium]|nr:hypothetical protein [Planctomycetota bacterium]
FSPRPSPRLVATYPIPKGGHALAISEGVDRDRAVDESGNQLAVFGRVGARPFNLDEQRRLYMRYDGEVWKVFDGKRDYSIADERQREIDLHHQLECYYGENGRRPDRRSPGGDWQPLAPARSAAVVPAPRQDRRVRPAGGTRVETNPAPGGKSSAPAKTAPSNKGTPTGKAKSR